MANKVYADDLNYWKSSSVAPDTWIEKAQKEITAVGGRIDGEAFGMDGDGKAAFMLAFTVGGDKFKIVFPVLEPRNTKDRLAAKRQAATMLYHDVKARCVLVKVFGARHQFAQFLIMPNGQTVGEAVNSDLHILPTLLARSAAPELVSGEIVK